MARLPSREDLSRVLPGPAAGGARVPSGAGGAAGLQRGARALASGLEALAKSRMAGEGEAERFETQKRLLEFDLEQDNALETLRREMPEGGPQFAAKWRDQFRKSARSLVGKGDKNIPADLRGAVGLRIKQIETKFAESAHNLERAEKDRYAIQGLEETLGKARDNVAANPSNYQERLKEGKSLVDMSQLPPEQRAALKEKFGAELDRSAISSRISSARSAADFEAIKQDLGVGSAPDGVSRASGLIVNAEARRDSKGRIQVYQIPSGDGGGRYEVAGINERYHPQAARKLAGMIRSGRHEAAEAYARQYITQYTQQSANLVEGEAAQYLVRDMAFNRGPGGANAALRMAIGIQPGSKSAAHRGLTAAERERVQEMARTDPEGFVRAFTKARADYEYTFVGRREKFALGLQRRWANAERDALRMLTGEMPEQTAELSGASPAYGHLGFKERDQFWDKAQILRKRLVQQVDDLIEELEKNAAVGKVLPPEEMGAIASRVRELDDPRLTARYTRTVGLAATIQDMHGRSVLQNEELINRVTESVPNPTPEQLEQIKTLKKVVAGQKAMIDDDALTWAHRTGSAGIGLEQLNPQSETFVSQLQDRLRQSITVARQYGIDPQYFTKAEREALGDFLARGGPTMTQFLGQLHQGFGLALGEAIKEIAPKQPELARAGMLVAYGGDPKAVEDIAKTLQLRADPNYQGGPKIDDAQMVTAENGVFGDFYDKLGPQERDATIRAARAVYEARVKDRATFDPDVYEEALNAVLGQRTVRDHSYGGVVDTRTGWFSSGDKVILPPNVRRDGWRPLFDSIMPEDLKAAGLALPVDGNGRPMSLTKAVNARIVQVAPNLYRFAFGDPTGETEPPRWVMAGGELAPPGSFRAAQDAGVPTITTPFELDFNKLGPILQDRLPQYFLKAD